MSAKYQIAAKLRCFESVTITYDRSLSGHAVIEWYSEEEGAKVSILPTTILLAAGLKIVENLSAAAICEVIAKEEK